MTKYAPLLAALAAVIAAVNTALLGLEGDAVPQWVIIGIGVANAAVAALAARLQPPPAVE